MHGSVAWASLENVMGDPISAVTSSAISPALAVEGGEPAERADALGRVEAGPGALVDGPPGGGHGPVDVVGTGRRGAGDDLLGVGRDHVDDPACGRCGPLTAYVEVSVLDHRASGLRPRD